VATDKHLIQCLVYIDLNMVRAGAVGHPSQWAVSGYHDLQSPPLRYRIIDYVALCQLTDLSGMNALSVRHREWVDDALSRGPLAREPKWTEEPAVGPDDFVSEIAATNSRR
jgi:putative transposase